MACLLRPGAPLSKPLRPALEGRRARRTLGRNGALPAGLRGVAAPQPQKMAATLEKAGTVLPNLLIIQAKWELGIRHIVPVILIVGKGGK